MKDEIVIKKKDLFFCFILLGVAIGCFIGGFMTAALLGFYQL